MARTNYNKPGIRADNVSSKCCPCTRAELNCQRIETICLQRKQEFFRRAFVFFTVAGILMVINILVHVWLLRIDATEKAPRNYPVHFLFVRFSLVTGIDFLIVYCLKMGTRYLWISDGID